MYYVGRLGYVGTDRVMGKVSIVRKIWTELWGHFLCPHNILVPTTSVCIPMFVPTITVVRICSHLVERITEKLCKW